MSWVASLMVEGMIDGPLPSCQKTAIARLHDYFLTHRHLLVEPALPPLLLLQPPPPLAAAASLGLLSGWLLH